MAKELTISALRETEFEEWDTFADGTPAGGVYSLARYLDILCSSAGGKFRIVAARKPDGTFCGGVALYEPAARFRLVSNRLLLYYNGLVLSSSASSYPSEQTAAQLETMGALETFLSNAGYAAILLHSRAAVNDWRVFLEQGWKVRPGYTYEMRLDQLTDAWNRVEKNLRRLINRATDAGYTLTTDDDFESFYRLHSAVSERKDAPLYLPREAFHRFVALLQQRKLARLYHARSSSGECAASQLVLASTHPVTHTVCAGSAAEHLKLGANPFLRWKSCEALARDGYLTNDLTDAALNAVTHFKSQLGGTLTQTAVVSKTFSSVYAIHTCSQRLYRGLKGKVKQLIIRS